MNMPTLDQIRRIFFEDYARAHEWLSAVALAGFFAAFWLHPQIMVRDSYLGFSNFMEVDGWLVFIAFTLMLLLISIFGQFRHQSDFRFIASCLTFGFWLVTTLSFLSSGVFTTAVGTYAALTFSSIFCGGFLAWKNFLQN